MLDGLSPSIVFALGAAVAYLVGAVPIGFLIARAFGVGDLARHGSGSIGATNVLRAAGTLPAVLTLIGDVAKGALVVWLGAQIAGGDAAGGAVAAVAAVVGNCWSVFLGFRGGKGVATGLGAVLMLFGPLVSLPSLIVFLVVVATTRYVSLGSLLGAVGIPVVALTLGRPVVPVMAAAAVALLIVGRHRQNIARLLDGTESRIGHRAPAS
jgi:glycerol-3-phosphate acyltransferase PlsY